MSNLRNEAYRHRQATEAWHVAVAATQQDEAKWKAQRDDLAAWIDRFKCRVNPETTRNTTRQYFLMASAHALAWERAVSHFMEIPEGLLNMTTREALISVVETCLAGIYQAASAGGAHCPGAVELRHEKVAAEMEFILTMLARKTEYDDRKMLAMIDCVMCDLGFDVAPDAKHGHGWEAGDWGERPPHWDNLMGNGPKKPGWKGWCEMRHKGVVYGRLAHETGKYPPLVR